MNLLFIADPNSIHDIKWMSFFAQKHQCFLVARSCHLPVHLDKNDWEQRWGIKIIGSIEDFSLRRYLYTLKQVHRLKAWVEEQQIDLLHIMYAEPNALWAYFRKKLALPIVLTTRGTDVLKTIPAFFQRRGPLSLIVSYLYKKALQNCDAITCTSYRQKESVEKLAAGRLKQAPQIIRTGVDIDKILADTSMYRLPQLEGKKYVFFPRAMRPLYQQEIALKAIALLPQSIREEYVFVFVNKDSSDKNYCQQIAALIEISQANILWLDNLAQNVLFQTYKEAKLTLMTPASDGSPVSAIEAMLCQCPLLLPPLDYDKDLFSQGPLYCSSWQETDWAAAIESILTGELKADTTTAYEKALLLADREKEMSKLEKIYLQCYAEK